MIQAELAERLNIADRTVSQWDTGGKGMPNLSLFKPLCDELKINVIALISGKKGEVFVDANRIVVFGTWGFSNVPQVNLNDDVAQ